MIHKTANIPTATTGTQAPSIIIFALPGSFTPRQCARELRSCLLDHLIGPAPATASGCREAMNKLRFSGSGDYHVLASLTRPTRTAARQGSNGRESVRQRSASRVHLSRPSVQGRQRPVEAIVGIG